MHQFDLETAVKETSERTFVGELSQSWNIGDNPNGGYMVACTMRALGAVLPHADPVSVTTHFLRPGIAASSYEVKVEVVRTGRIATVARATFSQEGKARVEVLCAYGDLDSSVGVDTDITLSPPALPSPDLCPQRSGKAQGIVLPILSRLDVRIHPEQAHAGQYPSAEVSGWIRFADGRNPDTHALPLFADAFPPSPFARLGVVGWVPTLELTVHIRRKPVPGWIRAQFITQDLNGGRMIETGALWDANGALVAQCRQLGLVLQSDG